MPNIAPLQLAFYKGLSGKHGALQFNMQHPHYFCSASGCKQKDFQSVLPKYCPDHSDTLMKSREGALFVEICSAKGKNIYDWENKIIFALSATDMSKLLMVCEGQVPEMKLMHDPGAKSSSQGKIQKWLTMTSPKGVIEGCIVQVTQSNVGGEKTTHKVPLSGDELKHLAVCLRQAISVAHSWC